MELVYNGVNTTIVNHINDTVTSLTVSSSVGFPILGDFRIRVEDELMLVTEVSGTVFTVVRGIEGTTPVAHLAKAPVYGILTAGAVRQVRNDPVSESQHLVYKLTDSNIGVRFDLSDLNQNCALKLQNKSSYVLCGLEDLEEHENLEGAAVHGLGSISIQDANNVSIIGGVIDGVTIGASDPESVHATELIIGSNRVVGDRDEGWIDPTGTAVKGGFDVDTVDLPTLAANVKAIYDALKAHGLIGPT